MCALPSWKFCIRVSATTSTGPAPCCVRWWRLGIWVGRVGEDSMTTTRKGDPSVARARHAAPLPEAHPQSDVFSQMRSMGHEQVLLSHDPSCGYLGIIAIHDTTLGPALGGTRFWQYASTDEAITDALRLARGMTYKSAVAGINLGGGKSVIIGENRRPDREALFRAHGRFI